MKLHFCVTEIFIELPLCSYRNATKNHCDNYLCMTIVKLLACLTILAH